MSSPIITIEKLGKRYHLTHLAERQRYRALRDVIAERAKRLLRRMPAEGKAIARTEEFWALRDISAEIKQGEVVGIVGRNGAGKSTLLKILSRVTEPTTGRVRIKGRVASLLEVGTGFHPELTGRENVHLNGAILGMTRAEIRCKFDEIVAFAEVEKFLDTPVKRYSSGMYLRLAFAVAAHLDPEILVVDEVLAVGDAKFQKKCLGKMSEAAGSGRTVLFVSHNMAALQALCPRSILLSAGSLIEDGPTSEVVTSYLDQRRRREERLSMTVQDGLILEGVYPSGEVIPSGDPIEVQIAFEATLPGQIRECALLIHSATGLRVALVDIRQSDMLPLRYSVGRFAIKVSISALPFVEGDFTLGLYLMTDRFDGSILELQEFSVTAPRSLQFASYYVPETRGLLVLNAASSVALYEAAVAS